METTRSAHSLRSLVNRICVTFRNRTRANLLLSVIRHYGMCSAHRALDIELND